MLRFVWLGGHKILLYSSITCTLLDGPGCYWTRPLFIRQLSSSQPGLAKNGSSWNAHRKSLAAKVTITNANSVTLHQASLLVGESR